jgi:hypothetical protein
MAESSRQSRFGNSGDTTMDTTTNDRKIVKQVILKYAQFRPSHGHIRLETVFDETQNRYLLMQVGWDKKRRISGDILYITLHDG